MHFWWKWLSDRAILPTKKWKYCQSKKLWNNDVEDIQDVSFSFFLQFYFLKEEYLSFAWYNPLTTNVPGFYMMTKIDLEWIND